MPAQAKAGAALVIDYGYDGEPPGPSLQALRRHARHDPLEDPGEADLTAHVDFTGIALAAQEAGLPVLGYTSQARFLFNCGLAPMLEAASVRERADALKLVAEHEMGELFKVLALGAPGPAWLPLGFAAGDRTHTL